MFRILVLASLVLLTSCSGLRITTEPAQKPPLNLALPDALDLDDIQFYTITKENAAQVLDELEKKGLKPVVVALSGNGYKVLALNIDKIKNYIILQQEIIKKYKEYYEGK